MRAQPGKVITAAIVSVLSLAALWFMLFFHSPKTELRPHIGFGQAFAQEAKRLAGTGGRVVLIAPDGKFFDRPAARAQVNAFEAELAKTGLKIATRKLVALDPLRPTRVPPEIFFDLLRKHSENDVVVSLIGPPTLAAEQVKRLPGNHPRTVAYVPPDALELTDLKGLFRDNLLHAIVLTRPGPFGATPAGGAPGAWFAHFFQIVNTADDLPSARP